LGDVQANGFKYPYYLLVKDATGHAVGMRIEQDGTGDNLPSQSTGKLISFPLTFDVWDCETKHSQMTLVEGDDQANEYAKGYERVWEELRRMKKERETIQ
jgi:hypothetical protein